MSTAATPLSYIVKLKSRQEVAERTMAFHFEKPPGFVFRAGQFIEMTLIDPPETDSEGNGRAFSIASAPHEETVMVTTRMRDTAFKRVLRTMPLASEVRIEGPFGDLVLHNNAARAAVLLAGGIGITPFRSILLRAANEKLPHRVFLFYSNRRPEDAPFLEELQHLEHLNPNYQFVGNMTGLPKSQRPWPGEVGHINKEMLFRHLPGGLSPIYYIAGPPGMVSGMRAVLTSAGVDDDDVRTEEFGGY